MDSGSRISERVGDGRREDEMDQDHLFLSKDLPWQREGPLHNMKWVKVEVAAKGIWGM